jgi:hypothetical protein
MISLRLNCVSSKGLSYGTLIQKDNDMMKNIIYASEIRSSFRFLEALEYIHCTISTERSLLLHTYFEMGFEMSEII